MTGAGWRGRWGGSGRSGRWDTTVMACVVAAVVTAASATSGVAQEKRVAPSGTIAFIAGDPSVGPPIGGSPYSGEATTTISQLLADGTRIERTTTTRVYRDGDGRLRREQTVQGLGALAGTEQTTVITIFDPVANVSYVLDPVTRTARRAMLRTPSTFGRSNQAGAPPPPPPAPGARGRARVMDPLAPPPPPPPPGPGARGGIPRVPADATNAPQALGVRTIEGLEALGTKRVEVIPTGKLGNDRPIEISDERWESTALKVLLQSRHSDPRTGVVEYRLTNISRGEPPRDLFVVPPDYRIVDARNER